MSTNKVDAENREPKESKPEVKYYFISYAFNHGIGGGFGNLTIYMECPHFDFNRAVEICRNVNDGDNIVILFYREITKEEFELSMQKKNEDSGETVAESKKIEREEQTKENDPEKQKMQQKLRKRYDAISGKIFRLESLLQKLPFIAWIMFALLMLALIPDAMQNGILNKDFTVKFLVSILGVLLMLMFFVFLSRRIELKIEKLEEEETQIWKMMKQ